MAADDLLIERLLRVIDEGRRTATYKLALLLGIIDSIAMSPGATELPTRMVAEQVLSLYYPQTRPFVDGAGITHEARQISMKSSPVLGAVSALRTEAEAIRCRDLSQVKSRLAGSYESAVETVEDTFVRYPIPLMQVVGSGTVAFLYHVDWPEGTGVRTLRKTGRDRLRLLEGTAARLAVLGPMLRPLIELHWSRDVARWSRIATEEESLRRHLFGSERSAVPRQLVGHLRDLQEGECFYCAGRLPSASEADHFLAWRRWPNDAVENLVLADRCNGAKSDHLAATTHLARWRVRLATKKTELAEIAASSSWPSDPIRSWSLVKTTYAHLAAGTPLWVRDRDFELADGPIDLGEVSLGLSTQ